MTIFSKAPFIITDSFHALTFSLLFHRPFIILLRGGKDSERNTRLVSLLEKFGLSDRAVASFDSNQINRLYQTPINWAEVDAKLDEFRKVGSDFLEAALRLKTGV